MRACYAGPGSTTSNFRAKVSSGKVQEVSLPELTFEGVLNDHYFDGGGVTDKDMEVRFSHAFVPDLFHTNIVHQYVGVATISKYDGDGIKKHKRPPSNIVIGLDVSGSMSGGFPGEISSKIEIAKASLLLLLDRLGPDDSFGLFTFESSPSLIQPLTPLKEINLDLVKSKVRKLTAHGGTSFEPAYALATSIIHPTAISTPIGTAENRIMILTDMEIDKSGPTKVRLFQKINENSLVGVYTTFIGIGLDFDAALVQELTTKIRGANYDTVKSEKSFRKALDRDFDHSVTSVAHAFTVQIDDENFEIDEIYGAPQSTAASNTSVVPTAKSPKVMSIGTIFPGSTNSLGEVKGALVLMKIIPKKNDVENSSTTVKVSYSFQDRYGNLHTESCNVPILPNPFPTYKQQSSQILAKEKLDLNGILENQEKISARMSQAVYSSNGVRKAVLLIQLTTVIREIVAKFAGNPDNKKKLQFFVNYFQDAMSNFEDKRLRRELKLLNNFAEHSDQKSSTSSPSSYPPPQNYYPTPHPSVAPMPTPVPQPVPLIPLIPTETEIPKNKDQENAPEGTPDMCLICMTKQIKTVNLPCGHRVYCIPCVHLEKQLKKTILLCPTCRTQLTKVIETF